MNPNSDYKELLECLNANRVEYLIIGGYAVGYHALPRATQDFDLWIKPDKQNAKATFDALNKFGAPLKQLGITQPDFEKTGYFVKIGQAPGMFVEFHTSIHGVPDFDKAYKERAIADFYGQKVNILSLDHMIDTKVAFGRPQDLADVKALREAKMERAMESAHQITNQIKEKKPTRRR